MKRILLTGMSGTGKSTVIAALVALGIKAVDTDYGWCETATDGEWIWNEVKIQELLSLEDAELLFIAGCASNQSKFYEQFDLVILLSAPAELMAARIGKRTENEFGKSAEEMSKIMNDLERVEPLLRSGAGAEVRTDRKLDEVIAEVIRLSAIV
jgi:dephospho-CoA kinase